MMSTVFYEKVYRFSQRSEGIENSNVAYYKAIGTIEQALYTGWVNKYTPWNIKNNNQWSFSISWSSITAFTGWVNIPMNGKWNSPYDSNYNIISIADPVQIVIPDNITSGQWNGITFKFRIPQITPTSSTWVISAWTSSGYILWTLASSGATLFASGETNIFDGNDISSISPTLSINLFDGITNSGSPRTFWNFYNNELWANGANCAWFKCTLKLSLIRQVPTTDAWRKLSFIEYKIENFPNSIPSQYMDIHAEWYAYGFLRSRDIKFPQITTNTALDFAVLQ